MKHSAGSLAITYSLLTLAAVILMFPLWAALSTSLVPNADALRPPANLFPFNFHPQNYQDVLRQVPVLRFLLNSFIQSGIVTVGQLITASLAAYAFSYVPFRGRQLMFMLFLATLMIPWEVTIIPNFQTIRWLKWVDTFQGLTAPFLATAFGTFLLRQSFLTIPRDLYDAAVMDGAGHLRYLATIVLPLSRPALGTLAVYSFVTTWNQFFWPLLVTNEKTMRTVQIGIAMLQSEEATQWNIVMAGAVLALLPTFLLLILGQKQLIRGLTAGALKG
jgi:sn-glycerol 3-phosphate transport system permease protein